MWNRRPLPPRPQPRQQQPKRQLQQRPLRPRPSRQLQQQQQPVKRLVQFKFDKFLLNKSDCKIATTTTKPPTTTTKAPTTTTTTTKATTTTAKPSSTTKATTTTQAAESKTEEATEGGEDEETLKASEVGSLRVCPGVCVATRISDYCEAVLNVDGLCKTAMKCCVTKSLFGDSEPPPELVRSINENLILLLIIQLGFQNLFSMLQVILNEGTGSSPTEASTTTTTTTTTVCDMTNNLIPNTRLIYL